MKKIAIFGCKYTTVFLLKSLMKKMDISCVITISPENGKKNHVADYANLSMFCNQHKIHHYVANSYNLNNQDDISNIANLNLDIAFVVGWQRLIPKKVLKTISIGVFGMHGSTDDLPMGRGRSPMNWALLEKRKFFFTNIFKYDPGVDSGDILDTFVFSIQPTDTSETMHYKNVLAMKTLILKNITELTSGKLSLTKQKDKGATYYPKRSPGDSIINWERDIFQIEAFIRAVTKPFNGAFSYIKDKKIILWRASVFETDIVDYGYRNDKKGTILEIFPSGKFLIRCRGGILLVHEFETAAKLNIDQVIESDIKKAKHFKLNEFGYHDLP